MTTACFVDLTPRGVLRCLSTASCDPADSLLRALLLRDACHAWQSGELARLAPQSSCADARTLFRLQRECCIDVLLAPPEDAAPSWDSLQSDLAAMVLQGAKQAALLDAEGMVLAQAGRSFAIDDPLSRPLIASTFLRIGEGAFATTYGLALEGLKAEDSPPLVRIARRLTLARAWQP